MTFAPQPPRKVLAISHGAVVLEQGEVAHAAGAQALLGVAALIDRLIGVTRHA